MNDTTDTEQVARRARHEAIRAEIAVEEAEAAEAEAVEKTSALDVPMHLRIDRELDQQLRQRASDEHIPTSALVRRLLRLAIQQGSAALSPAEVEDIARRVARKSSRATDLESAPRGVASSTSVIMSARRGHQYGPEINVTGRSLGAVHYQRLRSRTSHGSGAPAPHQAPTSRSLSGRGRCPPARLPCTSAKRAPAARSASITTAWSTVTVRLSQHLGGFVPVRGTPPGQPFHGT